MSRDRSNRDLYMFYIIAVKNRILVSEDFTEIMISQIKNIVGEVNFQDFIPRGQDEAKLREVTEILLLRDLSKLIDELKWTEKYTIKHTEHEYNELTSQKSEIVS